MGNPTHRPWALDPYFWRSVVKTLSLGMILILLLFSGSLLRAQEFTGRVTDSTGAAVVKAAVVARNLDTGVATATATTATGDYTIPYLIPGHYSVSVMASGFETGVH